MTRTIIPSLLAGCQDFIYNKFSEKYYAKKKGNIQWKKINTIEAMQAQGYD